MLSPCHLQLQIILWRMPGLPFTTSLSTLGCQAHAPAERGLLHQVTSHSQLANDQMIEAKAEGFTQSLLEQRGPAANLLSFLGCQRISFQEARVQSGSSASMLGYPGLGLTACTIPEHDWL